MDRRTALKYTSLVLGYSVSGMTVSAILSGCQPEPTSDFTPQFFSADQFSTIQKIVHQILPPTETPGGLDVLVDRFVDEAIHLNFTDAQKQFFQEELAAFEADAEGTYGKTYAKCSDEEQIALLEKWAKKADEEMEKRWDSYDPGQPDNYPRASNPAPEPIPTSLFRQMKELCLAGYFTSELIGEEVLSYDPIPGSYEPCKPLSEVGNVWSLG